MKKQLQKRSRNILSLSALVLASTIALGTGMRVYAAEKVAAPPAPPSQTQPNKAEADALLRYSQAGREAIVNIDMARRHINDGQADLAQPELKKAQTALMTAKAEAPTFIGQTRIMVQGKQVGEEKTKVTAGLVPVNSDVVLAENFTVTEKHRPFLARAKELFAKGDRKGGLETLKAGDIDVAVSRVWMPLDSTEKLLDQAISQAAKKEYYKANLTLKTIQDNLQTDTVGYDMAPGAAPKS